MQVNIFLDTTYVAHKVQLHGIESRFTIWFDQRGFITDADRLDSRNRSYPVRRGTPLWTRLTGCAYNLRDSIQRLDTRARRVHSVAAMAIED